MTVKKELKFRQALILGNFYNTKVEIITKINEGYDTIRDVIVGVKNNYAITKENGLIDKSMIKTIYKV